MIRLLIIDDHPLVAGGVASMLMPDDGIEVADAATTFLAGMEKLKAGNYDVLLLDINLPDADGIEACAKVRASYPDLKIIGLTSSNEAVIISQFLSRGGNGYMLKNMNRNDLLEAIEKVLSGKIYLSDAANEKLLQQFTSLHTAIDKPPILTRREAEVLQLLGDGFTGPQIADQLFISNHTVESHRKNLMQKLQSTNAQMMLKVARKYSLIK